jgi:hypothetical protein
MIFRARLIHLQRRLSFVRATLTYQQSLKCKECNPIISVVFLCSCADALKLAKGDWQRIKTFYERYCPNSDEFRIAPIRYSRNCKQPLIPAPFDKAIYCIYKEFRVKYIHEGIKHLRPEDSDFFYVRLKDEYGVRDCYEICLSEVVSWFERITFESLLNMLTTEQSTAIA